MIYKFSVWPRPEYLPMASTGFNLGLTDLVVVRDYYAETVTPLAPAAVERLRGAFGNALLEEVRANEPVAATGEVQVAHKRGIVDNENDSLIELCHLHGVE